MQLARHNLNYKWKHYLQELLFAQDIGASDITVAIGTEAKHIGAIDTEAKHTHIAEATVTNGALDITSLVIAASHVPAVDPRLGNKNFGWEEGGLKKKPAAAMKRPADACNDPTPKKKPSTIESDKIPDDKLAAMKGDQTPDNKPAKMSCTSSLHKLAYSRGYHNKLN